ncbi:MAG: hypothetical protein L0216_12455 [Planctomycetales bacterium]|nr:hypothetical protein [Planctomycetales bacterium]
METAHASEPVDEPRWCQFKKRQVIFECVPMPADPGATRPRRCLERERVCSESYRCLFAGGTGDPFKGSV